LTYLGLRQHVTSTRVTVSQREDRRDVYIRRLHFGVDAMSHWLGRADDGGIDAEVPSSNALRPWLAAPSATGHLIWDIPQGS
jgi:hypothetical protein